MDENLKKYQVLSGSALKLIAVIAMLLDHIASHLMPDPVHLFSIFGRNYTLQYVLTFIGRAAFPLYCFLLTEGFIYTKSKLKYGLNLLAFAFISEIPWDLEHVGKVFYLGSQNVFFTLFIGFCGMCAIEEYKDEPFKKLIALIILFLLSVYLHADYGFIGFGLILILYLLRERTVEKTVLGCCILYYGFSTILNFVPIFFYNGKRGFIKGKVAKYAFYIFYPLHIFIIYLFKRKLGLFN